MLRILGITPGGLDFEHELHKRLATHRLQYEWFADGPEIRRTMDFLCEPFSEELQQMTGRPYIKGAA